MNRVLVVSCVAVFVALLGSSQLGAATTKPNLGAIVLTAPQVGKGYVRHQLGKNGSCVGKGNCSTLDICDIPFPSEQLRAARLQVAYSAAASQPVVSNEVVAYKPGGADQALRDVRKAVSKCSGHTTITGTPVTEQVTVLHHGGLLPGSLALRVSVTGTTDSGKRMTFYSSAVYQARNDLLSAVYAYPADGGTRAAEETLALHSAVNAAKNLKQFA